MTFPDASGTETRVFVTHGAEVVSAQTAFTVQAADLRLRARLGHSLKERPAKHTHAQREREQDLLKHK